MYKNMKRIVIALAAVTMAFSATAQQSGLNNYIGLNFGGGLNTMTYKPANGSQSLGLGFDMGLHYAHFFNEHFGLGFGVHYTIANAYANYNFTEITTGLTHIHNPNVHYNLNTRLDNWKERQNMGVLGIPVEVFYRTALDKSWTFIGGLGVEFDLPMNGKYSVNEGEYTTTGTFASLGYDVVNMPEHGFATYKTIDNDKIDNLKMGVSVIADLGVRVALNNNWGLYLGLYGGYGVTNMLKEKKDASLLLINTADPSKHDYNGTFASNQINAMHLLRAGVKIGIDFGWNSHAKAEREAALRAYEEARAKAVADSIAAAEKAAAAKLAAEKAAAEKAAAQKAAAEKAAAEKAAAEKAAADKAAAEKLAADRAAAEAAAKQSAADRAAAEAAAKKAAADRAAAEAAAKKAEAERIAAERTRAEAEKQIKAIGATVYFENAGTNAKFDAKTDAAIHAICDALKADKNLTVNVYGHTDNTGKLEVNMKYGQKRAEALKAYMVKLGAPAASINCISRGPLEPVADNSTDEGRAKNRRATVELK